MENQIVLLDTSVLIDFYRKKDKSKSALFKLSNTYQSFAVSVVTYYEVYIGTQPGQITFWDELFSKFTLLPFDLEVSNMAVTVFKNLKGKNKLVEIPDLFIAATALKHNLACLTLNRKHFIRIDGLKMIEL